MHSMHEYRDTNSRITSPRNQTARSIDFRTKPFRITSLNKRGKLVLAEIDPSSQRKANAPKDWAMHPVTPYESNTERLDGKSGKLTQNTSVPRISLQNTAKSTLQTRKDQIIIQDMKSNSPVSAN